MTRYAQPDLFGEPQLDLFEAPRKEVSYLPDLAKVRADLLQTLAEAREASAMPWDARRTQYWRVVFPQMTNWLPADEAERLRAEFAAEMARLDAA